MGNVIEYKQLIGTNKYASQALFFKNKKHIYLIQQWKLVITVITY